MLILYVIYYMVFVNYTYDMILIDERLASMRFELTGLFEAVNSVVSSWAM